MKVIIEEHIAKTFEVDAATEAEAYDKAMAAYKAGKFVLDGDSTVLSFTIVRGD